jgi:hypothetical protein
VFPLPIATGNIHIGIIAGKLNGHIPAVTPDDDDVDDNDNNNDNNDDDGDIKKKMKIRVILKSITIERKPP